MELPKPINLLMPFRGHKTTRTVYGVVEGEIAARLEEGADPTMLPTTRLLGPRADKPSPLLHQDVTNAQARAMLDGFIQLGAIYGRSIEFKARGRGKRRRDQVHILPPSGAI
ncbi:MAG TPA: hypothetical protein VLT57_11215 [Bryobacteraceae bacterium]|nr:hypothetical protein [Bryobacteraceae bacterium]